MGRRVVASLGVVALLGIFICRSANCAAAEDGRKTLKRSRGEVVLKGAVLDGTLNRPIENLALLALHEGRLVPIAFQVDELDEAGEWVLTMVPPRLEGSGIEPDRDVDGGALDDNDELVFMLKDAGDRLAAGGLPEGVVAADEIELADSGGRAWVYLCCFEQAAPRSSRDYVRYDIETDRVVTDSFVVGFPAELPIAPGYLTVFGSENILDRMKIRLKVAVAGFEFGFDETDFISELSLYKDGPVRVIRRTRNAMQVSRFFKTPSAAIENVICADSCSIPVRVVVPISLKSFSMFFDMVARGGADFQNVNGWQFRHNCDPRWYCIDGRMDSAEQAMRAGDVGWFARKGPQGALLVRMLLGCGAEERSYLNPVATELYYMDDVMAADPPERVAGQNPNVAFWVRGMNRLGKGRMHFNEIMYPIADYSEEAKDACLDIVDRPVDVRVAPLAGPPVTD